MLKDVILTRGQSGDWLRFREPLAVVTAHRVEDVVPALVEVEGRVNAQGLHAAGFVSYEAAAAFDPALATRAPGSLPLICFGLYAEPEVVSEMVAETTRTPVCWQNPTSQGDYFQALAHIKRQIAAGNVYQVNHTLRLCAPAVPGRELFADFAAGAAYGAFVDADDFTIMSASPELFFTLSGEQLVSRPMKGTAPRGLTLVEDQVRHDWLAGSEKNRAENLMITDMVRNDVGRIAHVGSVQVEGLFRVEKYPTVWQMTSTVTAETRASIAGIFRAMFPGASITGAPKRASMSYIMELEDSPREIYTGCIGYLAPHRQAQFNIAIRTAWIDKATATMRYGVGGGIVWDSDPAEELEEIAIKTRVLYSTRQEQDFELLETMGWVPGQGVTNLRWHMQRLADSAAYFDFAVSKQAVRRALAEALENLQPVCHRVRLCVDRQGQVSVRCEPLTLDTNVQEVVLAPEPIDPGNPFLYHKTTNRRAYEAAARQAQPGQEVLLFNTDGCVTETNIANVVYRFEDALYTPPIADGLLPGTMRACLLDAGEVSERSLALSELDQVSELYLVNSLRGWRKARLAVKLSD